MSSDRARISYDAGQLYRSVVMQQGRVTLEADWNEGQYIASEETRKEALDFVGPAGTPDNGYAISVPNGLDPFDFQIDFGTMYVGGERAFLPSAIKYSAQPDWLDKANDPDFVPVGAPQTGSDYVFLFLREQEAGAVEDSDLKDVALGGPDSAQRTRLIQHIERTPTNASDCASALDQMVKNWASQGLTFDRSTMRLLSNASLMVNFVESGETASPCDPVAKGGYLSADNQLIRVQISDPDAEAGGNTLLWGFDDASFMYRVDVVDPNTIKLQTAPIDAEHQPRAGQAVELLMAGAQLGNGEFLAAPTGFVVTLTGAYNPDTKTISLPTAIPAIYGTGNPADPHPPRVFLRVWEQQLPFTASSAVTLGETGIEVTLQSSAEGFHEGFFWMFAVRPSTPQQVYPERYLAGPQPPDGPREWVCPLAIVQWRATPIHIISCRNPFDNLVNLTRRNQGGCCTINISPSDLTASNTLQNILDRFKGFAAVTICLSPGIYNLAAPLVLTNEHANFAIQGCPGTATLAAAQGSEAAFLQGMVILTGAVNVAIRNLLFQIPQAPDGTTTTTVNGVPQVQTILVSIGILMANCSSVEIAECTFAVNWPVGGPFFGAGIFGAGEILGLQVKSNVFVGIGGPTPANVFLQQALTGIIFSPIAIPGAGTAITAGAAASLLSARLDGGLFFENTFLGLSGAITVNGDVGAAEVASNFVRNCANGFLFSATAGAAQKLGDIMVDESVNAAHSLSSLAAVLSDPAAQFVSAFARTFTLPKETDLSKAIPVAAIGSGDSAEITRILQSRFDRIFSVMPKAPSPPGVVGAAVRVKVAAVAPIRTPEPVKTLAGASLDVAATNRAIDMLEQSIVIRPPSPPTVALAPFAVRISGNDVAAIVDGMPSGYSLLVVQFTQPIGTLLLSGNSISSIGAVVPTALISGLPFCTVTGNTILNGALPNPTTGAPFFSLELFPLPVISSIDGSQVAAVAVTGNVFRGTPNLPLRSLRPSPVPPMNGWEFFNTLV